MPASKTQSAWLHRSLSLYCCVCLCFIVDTSRAQSDGSNASSITDVVSLSTDSTSTVTISTLEHINATNSSTAISVPSLASEDNTTFSIPDIFTRSSGDKITTDAISTSNFISTTEKPKTNTSEVLEKWLHFENITKVFAKDAVKRLLPGLMEGTGNMNISSSCRRDVLTFIIGIRNIKAWAFSFIDSSGKFVDGMLSGTMASLGEYDQCVNIKVKNDRKGKSYGQVMFRGQYCALDIKPPLPPVKPRYYKLNDVVEELREFASGDNIINEAAKAAQFFHFLSMRVGICVPSGCNPSDVQEVLNIVAKEIKWTIKVNRCELKQENEFTPVMIGVMTAMSFFGFLLAVGSLIDLYHKYAQKKITNRFLEILVCFSFVMNFKKLINTKRNSDNSLTCLPGLKFLSISWIVLGHTYLNVDYTIASGLKNAITFQKDFFFQAVINASVAVDTFFFIGGLLVCYSTVKIVRDYRKSFNLFLYILHRIFRILPVYIMVIAFIFLAPIMGSGPIYHDTVDNFVNACHKNWWTNILFVNNFINTNQICLPQSWYVACDMQLYIAALIVILPILRWPWVGLSIASLGILASAAGTAAMTYIYEYPPTMLFIHPDIEQRLAYWANAYFKPYSHAGPYCIGLIVGYILVTHPKLKFSKTTRVIGWMMAIISNMSVLYGVYDWNYGRDPELIETLLYSGLHRVAWTFGVAWVTINCVTGQGGVVNYILSWKFWIPLGRLTYTIYLIHPIVQIAALGNIRVKIQIQHFYAVWFFFGHLLVTIGSAFAASMLVEAPFIGLEKILLRSIAGKSRSSVNEHAPMPSGSTTPKSADSGEQTNGPVSNL